MNATLPMDNANRLDLALHKAKAMLSVTASAVMCNDAPQPAEVYNTLWAAVDVLEEAQLAAGLTP